MPKLWITILILTILRMGKKKADERGMSHINLSFQNAFLFRILCVY